MKVRALRGVCIGVDQHLAAGDTADLEAAQVQYLASIGAVERLAAAPASEPSSAALLATPIRNPDPQPPVPGPTGKKEK